MIFAESSGLTEELIDESRLAVIYVGNDGEISQGAGHYGAFSDVRRMAPETRPAALSRAPLADGAPSGQGGHSV
ncbi:hypothetical protein [Qipengyuania sp.]|uniref:hypothetical protein n=1 Tax=Qipengyuania sp. TaxID=2004515 RepID=UPI0035C7DFB0